MLSVSDRRPRRTRSGARVYGQRRYPDALALVPAGASAEPTKLHQPQEHRRRVPPHRQNQEANAEYERAIALGNDALQINPRDVRTIALIALCEAKLGKGAAALRHSAEAVAMDSSSREAWQRSAEVHTLLNQPDAALRDLAIAVARGFEPRMARTDDELSGIRSLPRFEEILKDAPGNAVLTRGVTP